MFFFTGYTFTSVLVFLGLTAALIGLNEVTRRFKWAGIGMYVIIPVIATFLSGPRLREEMWAAPGSPGSRPIPRWPA